MLHTPTLVTIAIIGIVIIFLSGRYMNERSFFAGTLGVFLGVCIVAFPIYTYLASGTIDDKTQIETIITDTKVESLNTYNQNLKGDKNKKYVIYFNIDGEKCTAEVGAVYYQGLEIGSEISVYKVETYSYNKTLQRKGDLIQTKYQYIPPRINFGE